MNLRLKGFCSLVLFELSDWRQAFPRNLSTYFWHSIIWTSIELTFSILSLSWPVGQDDHVFSESWMLNQENSKRQLWTMSKLLTFQTGARLFLGIYRHICLQISNYLMWLASWMFIELFDGLWGFLIRNNSQSFEKILTSQFHKSTQMEKILRQKR